MTTKVTNQLTQQIVAGTVRNLVNGFLIERQSRGLSKQTIKFYNNELRYFCEYIEKVGIVNLDEINPYIIRQYLLDLRTHRNQGGVHAAYRAIKA